MPSNTYIEFKEQVQNGVGRPAPSLPDNPTIFDDIIAERCDLLIRIAGKGVDYNPLLHQILQNQRVIDYLLHNHDVLAEVLIKIDPYDSQSKRWVPEALLCLVNNPDIFAVINNVLFSNDRVKKCFHSILCDSSNKGYRSTQTDQVATALFKFDFVVDFTLTSRGSSNRWRELFEFFGLALDPRDDAQHGVAHIIPWPNEMLKHPGLKKAALFEALYEYQARDVYYYRSRFLGKEILNTLFNFAVRDQHPQYFERVLEERDYLEYCRRYEERVSVLTEFLEGIYTSSSDAENVTKELAAKINDSNYLIPTVLTSLTPEALANLLRQLQLFAPACYQAIAPFRYNLGALVLPDQALTEHPDYYALLGGMRLNDVQRCKDILTENCDAIINSIIAHGCNILIDIAGKGVDYNHLSKEILQNPRLIEFLLHNHNILGEVLIGLTGNIPIYYAWHPEPLEYLISNPEVFAVIEIILNHNAELTSNMLVTLKECIRHLNFRQRPRNLGFEGMDQLNRGYERVSGFLYAFDKVREQLDPEENRFSICCQTLYAMLKCNPSLLWDAKLLVGAIARSSTYHPSIAYFATKAIELHQYSLSCEEFAIIFASKCTWTRKKILYNKLSQQNRNRILSYPRMLHILSKICSILSLKAGVHVYGQPLCYIPTILQNRIASYLPQSEQIELVGDNNTQSGVSQTRTNVRPV